MSANIYEIPNNDNEFAKTKQNAILILLQNFQQYAQKLIGYVYIDQKKLELEIKHNLVKIKSHLDGYFLEPDTNVVGINEDGYDPRRSNRSGHYKLFEYPSAITVGEQSEICTEEDIERHLEGRDYEKACKAYNYDYLNATELVTAAKYSKIYPLEGNIPPTEKFYKLGGGISPAEMFYELASRFLLSEITKETNRSGNPNLYILNYSNTLTDLITAIIDSMNNPNLGYNQKPVVSKYSLIFIEKFLAYYKQTKPKNYSDDTFEKPFVEAYQSFFSQLYYKLSSPLEDKNLPEELRMNFEEELPLYCELLNCKTTPAPVSYI
jgi:hypothetical protein